MQGECMEFAEMRPRLLMLLELYRTAPEEARPNLQGLVESVFLAAAWNVATDLLENGWEPTMTGNGPSSRDYLKLVGS
jgi:hypothetical protein